MQFLSLFATLIAYLLGSASFAILVSKWLRLDDPRSYGSGNPGATNVLRSGSKFAAVLTLFLDGFKGWLPVFLLQQFGAHMGLGAGTVALVAMAAFVGHLWPLYFGFKGGKGVATYFGVLLGIAFPLGAACLLCWLLVAALFRYSSLASMVSATIAPLFYFFGQGWLVHEHSSLVLLALLGMALILLWRHRENIQRLRSGTEHRLGNKAGSAGS